MARVKRRERESGGGSIVDGKSEMAATSDGRLVEDEEAQIPDVDIECGICFERVLSKGNDARFGLLNCQHPFCLSCIRRWRSSSGNMENARGCPMCRVQTYFIIPSTTWVVDLEEKRRVQDEYKQRCSKIPCKHFNYGYGQCPFSTSCFYAHMNRDGTPAATPARRHIQTVADTEDDEDGIRTRVLGNVQLWDFLEQWDNRRTERARNAVGANRGDSRDDQIEAHDPSNISVGGQQEEAYAYGNDDNVDVYHGDDNEDSQEEVRDYGSNDDVDVNRGDNQGDSDLVHDGTSGSPGESRTTITSNGALSIPTGFRSTLRADSPAFVPSGRYEQ